METAVVFNPFGMPITDTVFFTWIVMAILVVGSWVLTRNLQRIPRGAQHVLELAVDGIEKATTDSMGKRGRGYVPLILTTAAFVFVSNVIGIFPGAKAPTADLGTTVALAIIIFITAHGAEIFKKGLLGYIKGYFEPFWWMFPMNLMGEISKILSHSFRLYGNIFGGAIILSIFYMLAPYVVPVPLMVWFGLFMGIIQTAVFTLLAIAYIQVRLE